MTAPTHIIFSNIIFFCIAQVFGLKVNPAIISICGFGSLLPDIDTPTSAIGRTMFPVSTWIERRFGHRTITHSFLGWVAISLVLSPLLSISKEIYIVIVMAILSHNLLDMFNITGVGFFYPSEVRAVVPYVRKFPKKFRIEVGSMSEFILLIALAMSLVIFYPIGKFGFRKCLHYILGDINGAVADYRDLAGKYNISVNTKAIDSITSQHFEGTYPVIGALGTTNLIIKKDDKLHILGTKDSADYRPMRIKCFPTEEINIIMQKVKMDSKILRYINSFLDETKEQYMYGTLLLEKDLKINQEYHAYNPIDIQGKYLILNCATWKDILEYEIKDVSIINGEISIKTNLKKGEAIKTMTEETDTKLNKGKRVVWFSTGNGSKFLVEEGDQIKKGSPLVVIGARTLHSPVNGLILQKKSDPAIPYCKNIKIAILD